MKHARVQIAAFWISILVLSVFFQNCSTPKQFSSSSESSRQSAPIVDSASIEELAETPQNIVSEETTSAPTTPDTSTQPPPVVPTPATTMYTHTNPVAYMEQYGYTASGLAPSTIYKLSFQTNDGQSTVVFVSTLQTDTKGNDSRFFALPTNLARGEYQVGIYESNGTLVSRFFALTVQ